MRAVGSGRSESVEEGTGTYVGDGVDERAKGAERGGVDWGGGC